MQKQIKMVLRKKKKKKPKHHNKFSRMMMKILSWKSVSKPEYIVESLPRLGSYTELMVVKSQHEDLQRKKGDTTMDKNFW